MFGYITLIVPSGLSLYWVTSNVLQIIQQGLTTGWSGLLPAKKTAAGSQHQRRVLCQERGNNNYRNNQQRQRSYQ